jgi:hypothetical protein
MPERRSRGFSWEREEETALARRAGTSKNETFKVFIDFSSVLMRKKLRPAVPYISLSGAFQGVRRGVRRGPAESNLLIDPKKCNF